MVGGSYLDGSPALARSRVYRGADPRIGPLCCGEASWREHYSDIRRLQWNLHGSFRAFHPPEHRSLTGRTPCRIIANVRGKLTSPDGFLRYHSKHTESSTPGEYGRKSHFAGCSDCFYRGRPGRQDLPAGIRFSMGIPFDSLGNYSVPVESAALEAGFRLTQADGRKIPCKTSRKGVQ